MIMGGIMKQETGNKNILKNFTINGRETITQLF